MPLFWFSNASGAGFGVRPSHVWRFGSFLGFAWWFLSLPSGASSVCCSWFVVLFARVVLSFWSCWSFMARSRELRNPAVLKEREAVLREESLGGNVLHRNSREQEVNVVRRSRNPRVMRDGRVVEELLEERRGGLRVLPRESVLRASRAGLREARVRDVVAPRAGVSPLKLALLKMRQSREVAALAQKEAIARRANFTIVRRSEPLPSWAARGLREQKLKQKLRAEGVAGVRKRRTA